MSLKKYIKLPIAPVITELYRQRPNSDFRFPPTPAGLLLESCPYIPSLDDFEGSRSILKRKVVDAFDAAMDALQSAGIITWRYKTCDTSSYQAFEDSMVAFEFADHPLRRHPQGNTHRSIST